MSNIYDVIVIGSGPAGHTASIYASRADFKVLVIEGWQPGGQLTTTTEVENFPGHKDGIMGPELMAEMKAQSERFGTEYLMKDVTKVDLSGKEKKVYVGDDEYIAKAIIIATGAKPRRLGLESETKLWSKGVSACATCDGFFFRDKKVAVIGGGDSAMEEANFLTKFASKVYLVHRRDTFRASQIMIDRTKENEKVEILTNKSPIEVLGEEKVTGLKMKDMVTGEESDIDIDGMFLAIGHIPVIDLFEGQIELDEHKFIVKKENTMTSQDGVFVAGDVADHRYKQGITAAGFGCMAALDAQKWIEDNK